MKNARIPAARIPAAFLAAALLGTAAPAILAPAFAQQETTLRGAVAEIFGREIVVAGPEGRILVRLPEGAAAPAAGTFVEAKGERSGATFTATSVFPATAPALAADDSALPDVLRGLGLTDARSRVDREDGDRYVTARMAEGGWLRLELRGDGSFDEAATDGAGLPDALMARILPEAVRAAPQLAELARVTKVEIDRDGEIEIEGPGRDGARVELEFGADGRLVELKRERDDRRAMREDAARARLAELGYAEIGWVRRGGRHVQAEAVNPYGERVEVRLNEAGEVERERMWRD